MGINTNDRTEQTELMDDFSLQGEELREALDKIARINQFLGGNNITLDGVNQLLTHVDRSKPIIIADIGCGNGDMLRMLAKYGNKYHINFKMIGIDANEYTINYARKLSKDYDNIDYICLDIFDEEFNTLKYDIALCTLTIHHFTNEKIIDLITIFNRNASVGIVVNDLQRSKLAYRLYQMVCFIFRLNKMLQEDGCISILRGFKRDELQSFAKTLNLKNYTIQWKWAFRYQWIILKI
ncbi:methyltransferase domain-containing protein [Sphingobacterium faecium]|jgi:2-polyprenyl-3-methyl-5-hydroxy-6-metoxy-1,4-benzoquinol methylase|uniref:methyltransferase domain-containing protein n=1 Tax=Sphingobacterium faecium TaxID=34087 RepID=UPI0004E5FDCD|nr:methyltransferase domain-containing protein [Sphingobacterium faecium]WGQ14456.1 methyltransferase domain-containing protein [Sphingobacterium faecium]CDT30694.1 Type 12 methyltransferase [Sphingobacterium sp. PM2-P1-29]